VTALDQGIINRVASAISGILTTNYFVLVLLDWYGNFSSFSTFFFGFLIARGEKVIKPRLGPLQSGSRLREWCRQWRP
jgi:hypothetical protein